ncbi:MAG: hypothetical protein U0Q16_28630 [Bryobacteraceae bacterium]
MDQVFEACLLFGQFARKGTARLPRPSLKPGSLLQQATAHDKRQNTKAPLIHTIFDAAKFVPVVGEEIRGNEKNRDFRAVDRAINFATPHVSGDQHLFVPECDPPNGYGWRKLLDKAVNDSEIVRIATGSDQDTPGHWVSTGTIGSKGGLPLAFDGESRLRGLHSRSRTPALEHPPLTGKELVVSGVGVDAPRLRRPA